MLGRLSLDAIPHNIITLGGAATMVLGLLAVIALITYLKRWRWLWQEWLTTQDPKKIGVMYLVVAAIMLLRGLGDAALMRAQQATGSGGSGVLGASLYQQILSAHGTIMIFFVAMGIIFGLFNLLIPLMIGARDVAFPFLNATSLWLFVAAMVLINVSLGVGEFAATGWLAYPPLSELQYSPGTGVDYWIWSLQIAGIGSLLSGINFVVTILRMRAPGMTLKKMPIFVWSSLGSLSLIIFAFPILTVSLSLLALDRLIGTHFFTSFGGGNPMMYINLIWAWGHPEVYILVLPAFGIFSEIVPVFSQKRLFGYTTMVWAIWAIVALSFLVWVHHFFTMGAGADVNAFFGIMTMVIAVPTGVKVFNWLFTMFRGRVKMTTPMMWFLGFVVTFTVGGMAGVLMSIPAVDFELHNSLFLVAHFHTMIIGGVVFGAFAGLTYWFPKFTGIKLNERLGKYAFWLWLIGFLTAFVPLYILGLMGATRRLDHYDPSLGWKWLFWVAAAGVGLILLGVGFQLLQVGYSIWKRKEHKVGPDPWNARTLEWSVPTPVPVYNFATIPTVTTRDAFWEQKQSKKQPKAKYQDIVVPKNTAVPLIIGACAFVVGFALIWYMWWLAALAFVALVITLIVRLTNDDTEFVLKANDVAKMESKI